MSILIFIFILVVLIVGHEFGHFLAAKLSKMKVEEFGIGFPPRLWGKKLGETLYSINALPFGGFVRIFGEDEKEGEIGPGAFTYRSRFEQAFVLLAGPCANLVLAFLFLTVAFSIGTSVFVDETNAAYAKDQRVLVTHVVPESPAEQAGVKLGDHIVSIIAGANTAQITAPADVAEIIARTPGPVTLTVHRLGGLQGVEILSLTATPLLDIVPDEPERKALGVATLLVGTVSYPLHIAIAKGFEETIQKLIFVASELLALLTSTVTFSADFSQVAGPVGIAAITNDVAAFGVGSLLSFAALISINLFIINLLPFPALDGGRLAFLIVETVARRKIPAGFVNTLNTVGFALLILLVIAVTAQDISRLVG